MVEHPVLSLLWLGLLRGTGLTPVQETSALPWGWQKKKKKKERRSTIFLAIFSRSSGVSWHRLSFADSWSSLPIGKHGFRKSSLLLLIQYLFVFIIAS